MAPATQTAQASGIGSRDAWKLLYQDWDPQQQPLREALCTLGNGYLCTRGAAEEHAAGQGHYPGTYLACGYNRVETKIANRVIENEDLVNWPNWLGLSFRHDDGDWLRLDNMTMLRFHQELDLKQGILQRSIHFQDDQQRETRLVSRRFMHSVQPNVAALQWHLTPLNWAGAIEIRSLLDGSVQNAGVQRYQELNSQHLNVLSRGRFSEDAIFLCVESNQSHVRMAQVARTQVTLNGHPIAVERETQSSESKVAQHLFVSCEQSKPLCVEKIVTIYTSRDHAISEPLEAAQTKIERLDRFSQLLDSHVLGWQQLWQRCDLEIDTDSDVDAQMILRLHLFHLLQTCSMNTVDRDIGVPARGWHGEAYRGHIFWDELFIFPFLNLRLPELTRELLMYRFRRLDEARQAAQQAGYRGAMFPWQSGSSGREESQTVHLNPRSGRWVKDNSHQQRHVNAAIAYNVWQYYQATADLEFMSFYGAELMVEIARFWASLATYHASHDRFEIRGVMGPDEFHTQYPDREELGLDNNAYTNILAVWTILRAQDALSVLSRERRQELVAKLGIEDEEWKRWDDVTRKMFVPFHGQGIISQFEGYQNLHPLDWDRYRERYDNIQRLDRILESEDDSPNRYQVSKQADVLMLFYLFSTEELAKLFTRLGYPFEPEMITRNIDYYSERTSHGSTLSRVVHAWVLARNQREQAWQLFRRALYSDISDVQGGTTPEGIHLGAMAGTVDLIQRCFTGIETREDVLWINPRLPRELKSLCFRIRYRGHGLSIQVDQQRALVAFERGWSETVKIGFRQQVVTMHQGESREFRL